MMQQNAISGDQRRRKIDLSFIGLGANLQHPVHGSPRVTLAAAITALAAQGLEIVARSSWYESAPVPLADQPWYVNGVVAVRSPLAAADLLQRLHRVEAEFGRVRSVINAPRVIDLDLLDYRGERHEGTGGGPVLPHPRMTQRAFVLLPLREIAPDWVDPISGRSIGDLVADLPVDQVTRPLI